MVEAFAWKSTVEACEVSGVRMADGVVALVGGSLMFSLVLPTEGIFM